MPCNAIATVRARVAQDEIAKLLTPEVVGPVVKAYLEAAYPHLELKVGVYGQSSWFQLGDYQINIEGGSVNVSSLYGDQGVGEIATGLLTLLTTAGGQLFQMQLRARLASRYAVTEEQRAPNGGVVLTLEV